MHNRERFLRTMHYETVDHPPLMLDVPWPRTIERWHREGWPMGVSLHDYFEVEPLNLVNVGPATRIYPDFEKKVLEVKGENVYFIDQRGVTCMTRADYEEGILYLDYSVKGSADIPWLDARLNPDDPGRWANGWDKRRAALNPDQDLGTVEFGSFYGDLHEHMGTEQLSVAYFDDPDFIHWYNDRLASCCERAIARLLPDEKVDMMTGHEDMAFKNGPFISPDLFREFMTPYYKRTVGAARKKGQTLFWQDSDGNVEKLIPLWLELGINLITPMEVAANMDVAGLRASYGKDLLMCGGIDKRALIAGKKEILREVMAKEQLVREGGYVPRLDHTVAPDISWPHYCYYIETLKALYGI